jgi:hypothetical protein
MKSVDLVLSGALGLAAAAFSAPLTVNSVDAVVLCENITGCTGNDGCAALVSVDGCTLHCVSGGTVTCRASTSACKLAS